ncbi:MAG: tetratricopeptide repeat protein, partial [Bacteroidales bacterium]|nr:tetratricopeptide repeat protein [Bacteroidales bacterium]
KILDFGLAKLKGQSKLTKVGTTIGTAAYMSPEQAKGQDVDHRTDIWSLGVVMYKMLTGQLPFKGDYDQAVIYSILNEEPETLSIHRTDIPVELEQIINKALAKNPAERYQSAIHLLEDVRKVKEDTVPEISVSKIDSRSGISSKISRISIIAVAVILAAAMLWIFVQWQSSSNDVKSEDQKTAAVKKDQPVPKRKIIVLPFDDMSPNKDNEYFSDGLTEEIITDLSHIHDLLVISRSSAMTFKGTNKKIKEIAREVNVQFVLQGSVRKAGNNLRITAQLIDAASDAHLWAEKYSGTLDDVFDIQEKVSRSIVDALKMKLTSEEKKKIAKRSTDNVHAYDCWIQAKYDISKSTKEAFESAINNLQNALDIIGDNALLYAGIGYAYFRFVNWGLGGQNYIDKAVQYVQKAFVLDPDIPLGHVVMGAINSSFYGDQKLSIEHLNRALKAEPNSSEAMYWLGITFLTVGKMPEVVPLAKKISQVDPLNFDYSDLIAMSNLFNGHYERALKIYERILQLAPGNSFSELMLATSLSHLKRYEEAITLINKSAGTSPDHHYTKLGILLKFALQGKKAEMLHSISQELEIWAKRDPWGSWMLAERYSLLGMKEKALDWLKNSVDRGWINYPHLSKHNPLLDNIRGEERFKKLMKQVKHEWENFEE